jgi:cobalt/nickel transport system permease protein
MPGTLALSLWAVHISDGVLTWPWLTGGFVAAVLLAIFGAWRIRDEEIPQVAVLTAAFFVASLVHVRVPPTSVHLLLNGLVGVVLGRRAALAIPVGLFLQAALIGHGGFSTLGVNSCVMVLPALLAWQLFTCLQRVPWIRQPWFRSGLVAASTLAWCLSLIYGLTLLAVGSPLEVALHRAYELLPHPVAYLPAIPTTEHQWAAFLAFHPITLTAALILAVLAAWGERRLENAPEFPIGLLVGEVAVLATAALNCLVLAQGHLPEGDQETWETLAQVVFLAHLPIAVIEGVVLGFTVGFLARVKPEMLGWVYPESVECSADSVP